LAGALAGCAHDRDNVGEVCALAELCDRRRGIGTDPSLLLGFGQFPWAWHRGPIHRCQDEAELIDTNVRCSAVATLRGDVLWDLRLTDRIYRERAPAYRVPEHAG